DIDVNVPLDNNVIQNGDIQFLGDIFSIQMASEVVNIDEHIFEKKQHVSQLEFTKEEHPTITTKIIMIQQATKVDDMTPI
ncbi:hypothetical protein HAX54_037668, partial [Datura stramonium]|nr:hypothetical protein [Datura stramonium]